MNGVFSSRPCLITGWYTEPKQGFNGQKSMRMFEDPHGESPKTSPTTRTVGGHSVHKVLPNNHQIIPFPPPAQHPSQVGQVGQVGQVTSCPVASTRATGWRSVAPRWLPRDVPGRWRRPWGSPQAEAVPCRSSKMRVSTNGGYPGYPAMDGLYRKIHL